MEILHGYPVLRGGRTPDFGFRVMVIGDTLHVQAPDGDLVEASFFGGSKIEDPEDNGETACGPRTRNPDGTGNPIAGFSLPHDPHPNSGTMGSPLCGMPCGIPVTVTNPATGRTVTGPMIDNGPAYGTGHAIDCTRKTFADLGGEYGAGLMRVSVTIPGGATHLSDAVKAALAQAGFPVE